MKRKYSETTGSTAPSYLVAETSTMEDERRYAEQEGQRRFARVHQHAIKAQSVAQTGPAGELQNDILQHPRLKKLQRYAGHDNNVNPAPPLNSTARTEFDNERREQDLEKQYRLGHMPTFSSAPKPQGP